jgi:L-fucose isomerase-like protein
MTACSGELVSCEDTEFCRNTLGVRIAHVRRFVEEAEGNHHALVFGNWMEELELLCNVLDCDLTAT